MNKPGEPTEEFREAMRKAGIDPDAWLKKARAPQPNLLKLLRPKFRFEIACDWVRGDASLRDVIIAFNLSSNAEFCLADSVCLAEIGEDLWGELDQQHRVTRTHRLTTVKRRV